MAQTRDIVAPNLMKEKYFMSEHGGTPDNSDFEDETPKVKKT